MESSDHSQNRFFSIRNLTEMTSAGICVFMRDVLKVSLEV